MLSVSDLEVNLLEFRQRAFQFARLGTVDETPYAVFSRTETESESQFRPRLVHLHLVVPLAWIVYDEPNDVLRLARDGSSLSLRRSEPVAEVGAEPSRFREQGIDWSRETGPAGAFLYAPADEAARLLAPAGRAALGLA